MKKLLQINSVVNSGSTGRIAEEIGQASITAGWESYIAYGRNERPSSSKLIKIGNNNDIKLHGVQTRLFDRHGLGSRSATGEFIKQIEVIKPDIVHLHNLHGYYINIEVLFHYLKKANIPVVWTLHDCWPVTGHCVYFDFVGCEKWKTQCFDCPQKTTYPGSFFIDRSEKNYTLKKQLFTALSDLTLVPVSMWLGEVYRQSFLKKYPVQVIHNGINLNTFQPVSTQTVRTKYGLENKFIILGVASEWIPRKGLKDFIEINEKLDSDFCIILVGLTQEQVKSLPENMIGIERTESIAELVEFYSESDLFLNLTYEDNFPTTNLEALACGTPVVTYKTGGSPEAIDENTGIVVDKGDISELLNAINHIKNKGKKYYSEACVSRARDFYNKDERYREYLGLYENLLSENRDMDISDSAGELIRKT